MISVQSLELKKNSLVLELAEVHLFLFIEFSDIFLYQVPVVVIFTKFDAIEDICYGKLRGQGKSHEEASLQLPDLANKIFQQEYLPHILDAEFPPKTFICLAGNMCYILISSLNSHEY